MGGPWPMKADIYSRPSARQSEEKLKTLTANQNPPDFKWHKHLKRQWSKLQCALIINVTLSWIPVNVNTDIITVEYALTKKKKFEFRMFGVHSDSNFSCVM